MFGGTLFKLFVVVFEPFSSEGILVQKLKKHNCIRISKSESETEHVIIASKLWYPYDSDFRNDSYVAHTGHLTVIHHDLCCTFDLSTKQGFFFFFLYFSFF